MAAYTFDKFLIITKTYPSPSSKYQETSCVAAINQKGEMRRLYPVPYRLMQGASQFSRWEWIKTRSAKADNDHRPESYHIDVDSIKRLSKLSTDRAWSERLKWLEPHIYPSFAQLEQARITTGKSLGIVRPSRYKLIIRPSKDPDWTEEEKIKLNKFGLFDATDQSRVPLRKIPCDYYYEYEIDTPDGPEILKHKIVDWEIGQLYWNCVKSHGVNWETPFRQKLEDEFSSRKDLYLLLGTVHRFPDLWLIVGLIYPPKVDMREHPLFQWVPDA